MLKFRFPPNAGVNPAQLSNGKLMTQTVLGTFPIFHLDMATAASWGCVTVYSSCPLFNSIWLCPGGCQASCSPGTGNTLETRKWFHRHHSECMSRLLAGHPWRCRLAAAPGQHWEHWAWGCSLKLKSSSRESTFPCRCFIIPFS